jgi:hypothetical protein
MMVKATREDGNEHVSFVKWNSRANAGEDIINSEKVSTNL